MKYFYLMPLILALNLAIGQEDLSIIGDSIVITASKVWENERKTTRPVLVISRQDIEQKQGYGVDRLLQELAGIQINGAYSSPGKDRSIYLRGAGSEYTLFLIDGLPINDPSSIGASIDLRHFSVDQIERIEILKGSQSALYGSDAIAGVINIITRAPSEKNLEGNLLLEGGSFRNLKAQTNMSGKQKGVSYHWSASHHQAKGFSEAKAPEGEEDFDKDGFIHNTIMAKLGFNPLPKFEITPLFRFARYRSDYDEGAFTDGSNTFSGDFLQMGLQQNYNGSRLKGKILYNFNHSNRLFSTSFGAFNYSGASHHAEAFISYTVNKNMDLLIGLYHTNQLMQDESALFEPEFSMSSAYGKVKFSSHNFQLEMVGRANLHSGFGQNLNYNITPSWVLGRSKFFLSANTGFKAPNISQLYGPFGANPYLLPQTSQNFEAGWRLFAFNDGLDFQIQYFYRTIDNVIQYEFNGYVNRDLQKDRGIEWTADARVNKKFSTRWIYTYVLGSSIQDGTANIIIDNLYRRPKHHLVGVLSYLPSSKWNLSVTGIFNGKRKDLYFDFTTFESKVVDLKPYTLLHFQTQYHFNDKWRIYLNINNLTNINYVESYGFTTPGIHAQFGINLSF